MKNLDLQMIRGQLDEIDNQIVELFETRMKVCEEVAEFKIETGKPVYDSEREQQKIAAVKAIAHGAFNEQAVGELFSQMMTISRRLQYQILERYGVTKEETFEPVKALKLEGAKVVYQGVPGAYSHAATLKYFGEAVDTYHVPTWAEAMEAVWSGHADYAVLPIENSSAGAVIDNYDLLIRYPNVIVAETMLPVNHTLLGVEGSTIETIETVFSHPQALMQCSDILNAHKEWKQVSVENTAMAAQKILKDQDKTQAAVASETAGKIYGLKTICPVINNNKNNTTRFIIVGNRSVYLEKAAKISICFELPHQSGSLYNILSNFIYNQVNMRMIESRPIAGKIWEYRFFVDIEGNLSDAGVKSALNGISKEAMNMRILGNY